MSHDECIRTVPAKKKKKKKGHTVLCESGLTVYENSKKAK